MVYVELKLGLGVLLLDKHRVTETVLLVDNEFVADWQRLGPRVIKVRVPVGEPDLVCCVVA